MKLNHMLGNVDVPVMESLSVASGAVAFKHPVWIVPDLSKLAAQAKVNARPQNAMRVRAAWIVPEATFTGVVTNNLTLALKQNRAGAPIATIASLTVDNTVTLTALVQKLLDGGLNTPQLLPGDVITFEAAVNGTGGSALPAMTIFVDVENVHKNS